MGKKIKKGLAIILSAALVLTCIPAMAFAEVATDNDQNVITGATHGTYPVEVSGKTLTVTVPYGFTGTVNVGNIVPTWDSGAKEII